MLVLLDIGLEIQQIERTTHGGEFEFVKDLARHVCCDIKASISFLQIFIFKRERWGDIGGCIGNNVNIDGLCGQYVGLVVGAS